MVAFKIICNYFRVRRPRNKSGVTMHRFYHYASRLRSRMTTLRILHKKSDKRAEFGIKQERWIIKQDKARVPRSVLKCT